MALPAPTFLALDLGTTFLKGGILDLEGLHIRHIRRRPFPAPVQGLPPRHHEVAVAPILAAVHSLVQELLAQAPDCRGIVLCSQMHGVLLTDETGRALTHVITWQDQRALDPLPDASGVYLDQIRERLPEDQIRELGNELRPGLPLCNLYWLAARQRLPGADARVISLPDYVAATLGRAGEPFMEPTNGAACGALNLHTLRWHDAALAQLGLDRLIWPPVRPFGTVSAVLSHAGKEVPIFSPVGDHQCALVGAFVDQGELSLNLSTGAQASLITGQLQPGDYQSRPFLGRYLNTITHIPAGRALNALISLLTEIPRNTQGDLADPWAYAMQAVNGVPSTDLRVDLRFFESGSESPGRIGNIRGDNLTVGHLFRGALNDMAGHIQAAARRLAPQGDWQRTVFSGGLAQNWPALRQAIGSHLGNEHRIAASAEDTLLGLLALALVADGRAVDVAAATRFLLQQEAEGHAFV